MGLKLRKGERKGKKKERFAFFLVCFAFCELQGYIVRLQRCPWCGQGRGLREFDRECSCPSRRRPLARL